MCGPIVEVIDSIGTTDEDIKLEKVLTIEINGEIIELPSMVSDFVNSKKIDPTFKEKYIVNAGEEEFVSSVDYAYSIHAFNTTDKELNFIECELGGIEINVKNALIDSFNFKGITLESTYDEVVDILGLPSYKSGFKSDRYATWYSNFGWITITWDNSKIDRITINHDRMLENY